MRFMHEMNIVECDKLHLTRQIQGGTIKHEIIESRCRLSWSFLSKHYKCTMCVTKGCMRVGLCILGKYK